MNQPADIAMVTNKQRLAWQVLTARWTTVALLALALVGTAFATRVDSPEQAPRLATPKTECMSCHAQDPLGNLVSFTQFTVPEGIGAKAGEAFSLVVTLQNVWNADMIDAAPTLDRSHAPSILFSSNVEPYENERDLSITFPTGAATQPASQLQSFGIPAGASEISFTVTPKDENPQTGADLVLVATPTGSGSTPVSFNDQPAGKAESHTFTGANAAPFSGGTIQVGAQATQLDTSSTPPHLVPATTAKFTVKVHAAFNLTGLLSVPITISDTVPKHGSKILAWPLQLAKRPEQGE